MKKENQPQENQQEKEIQQEQKPQNPSVFDANGAFDFRGEKYRFSPDAPELIRMENQVFTHQELAQNQDLILELVAGDSYLIQKI